MTLRRNSELCEFYCFAVRVLCTRACMFKELCFRITSHAALVRVVSRVSAHWQVISVSPDRYRHAALIAAYDRASHWQRACRLLASWDQTSGEKDSVIFNAAISACATCEQWQQSLHLLLGDVGGHGAKQSSCTFPAATSG